MQDDLLVVGLDLETGREVHVSDPGTEYWYARGYSGSRTLVCALCYAGIDVAPARVPLVVRGRLSGVRRPHFAHPPGQSPTGGHRPESVWHLSAKVVLAAWARRQLGVVDVMTERCTPDRARRSDIHVRFSDGREVALEVQATPLTDRAWSTRHADYQRQDIIDIWLWRPGTRPHWVAVDHGQPLWELDPSKERLYLLLGAAHDRPASWWSGRDLHLFAQHEPPCVGDALLRREVDLSTVSLTADGLATPDSIRREITSARANIREAAEKDRAAAATRMQRRHRPQQPRREVKPGKLTCKKCGQQLDPILARLGHHILC